MDLEKLKKMNSTEDPTEEMKTEPQTDPRGEPTDLKIFLEELQSIHSDMQVLRAGQITLSEHLTKTITESDKDRKALLQLTKTYTETLQNLNQGISGKMQALTVAVDKNLKEHIRTMDLAVKEVTGLNKALTDSNSSLQREMFNSFMEMDRKIKPSMKERLKTVGIIGAISTVGAILLSLVILLVVNNTVLNKDKDSQAAASTTQAVTTAVQHSQKGK